MSRTEHQTLDVNETEQGNRLNAPLNPPLTNQNQEKQPEFADGSGPLFLMYRRMTEEEDNKMVERWQKDAEGIVIFTGLLSAAVASLLSMAVGSLNPNSQDAAAFYLQNIYQLLAINSTTGVIGSPAILPFLNFSPPGYAVWVNGLLFLSLAVNLSCAMMATMIRQWARRYLRITQSPRYSLHERARIRAFFSNGVDKFRLPQLVEGLPVLIEISLFLFFSSLLILLASMNFTVLQAVSWLPAFIFSSYPLITIMPVWRHESPYYSHYSSFIGLLGRGEKLAAETVRKRASEIDNQIFKWVFDNLAEDHDSELAQFFESICSSSILQEPLLSLTNLGEGKLSSALSKFLERAWSFNFVSDSDKMRRLVVCVKTADVASLSDLALSILEDIFPGDRHKVLRSVGMGRSLTSRDDKTHQEISLCAKSIVAGIISNVQRNDDHWIAFAADQLGKPEGVVRGYLEHGNESVLLANLIHITRQIFHSSSGDRRAMADAASYILPSLSNFDIRNTLPGLQHDFLTLWDEIDREAQNNSVPAKIRDSLRELYNALNPGTDDTSTTPASNTNYNHPSDSAINENSHTHITTSLPVSHQDAGLATVTHSPANVAIDATNDTSSMPNPIPQSTLNGGAAPQYNEAITIGPPAMVPGSLSSPTLMPAPSNALAGGLHSLPDSTEKDQSYALPHTSVPSSSSSTAAFSRAAVHVASSSHPNVTTTITSEPLLGIVVTRRDDDDEDVRTPTRPSAEALGKRRLIVEEPDPLGAHDDTQGPNVRTHPKLSRRPRQSESSAANTVTTTLQHENRDSSEDSAS